MNRVKFLYVLVAILILMLIALALMYMSSHIANGRIKYEYELKENIQLLPEFIGEEGDIMEYLGYNLKYPEEAIKAGVNIRVFYNFVVAEDGTVTDIKWSSTHVDKDADNPDVMASVKACTKAAYDIIASTSGKWQPVKKDGVPVKAEMSLPIWFKFY